ncbi:type I-D CRISPR-associated protein Cas10d/Csc3 [Gloeothece verrucosa]|uniref:CRISPR-associated protein Csc3 n=1 Tax=Gloeothece verrucosa (strain PCC 7822) TaxID=497965 RepID=E0UKL9_GLOV7|nr:type I-D CRISPR-associated protein Cas10d/Csc3 [Gloeothece verrucosa]ADN17499.1 CRISPR-associated protein Csc3 [Gloeothece verrucosa PCC 7822]
MLSLLKNLLLETLPEDTEPILRSYVEIVVPAMEKEFALISALGGSEDLHFKNLTQLGDRHAKEKAQRWSNRADQSLLVHVLNALLTAWNLLPYLHQPLSDLEKYLLCLGLTLHDYNKYCIGGGEESPHASDVEAILIICQELGEKLNFQSFWPDWKKYLSEIAYLAQNTQFKAGTNMISANYPPFKIPDHRRLQSPLRHLLAFGDLAVHLQDPAQIETETSGDRLREHLRALHIRKQLVYHRLRDTLGILTNVIHNATMLFTQELEWKPILFFAQGVVYLAPPNYQFPDISQLQEFIWQLISERLGGEMSTGRIGFKRDGKGLKVAPQTLELFSYAQLIKYLPDVIIANVANAKNPATPKRLEKLPLTDDEHKFLKKYSDLRADHLAEFIILAQREFFNNVPEYISWMLEALELSSKITPEQTQEQSGGVNYGWYRVAAYYVASHATLDSIHNKLIQIAENLSTWAEENHLFPQHQSPTREVFYSYLSQYLEIKSLTSQQPSFTDELTAYTLAKTKAAKQPICSLRSGEYLSEDQMDSVVLFKPQQYSNKNPLGGRKIKRGISKILSLEMLLRQACWSAVAGKLEEQNPIFLYIFPAYIYSPQMAAAIRTFTDEIKGVYLKKICQHWLQEGMDLNSLRSFPWLEIQEDEAAQFADKKYHSADLPFMATVYTTTRGNTVTEAWIEPAFLAVTLPFLLGVKVVATSSFIPLYNSDEEFLQSVLLDGVANFWHLLHLPSSLRIQDFSFALKRLLTTYSLHLSSRGVKGDPRWQDLIKTVRQTITDILNVFALANQGLRKDKRDHASLEEVYQYWQFAELLAQGNKTMEDKLKVTQKLVNEYRQFYQVGVNDSSHAILLPLTKALEVILSTPENWDDQELIDQGSGLIQAALERQDVYKRPLIKDKTIDYTTRQIQELEAIQTFMTTCVKELFGQMCKGDRALLQESRNRIKAGAEFAYRRLCLQEKTHKEETNS